MQRRTGSRKDLILVTLCAVLGWRTYAPSRLTIVVNNPTLWAMSNTTMSIAIPDSMRKYVCARVESGAYGNMSEYFRELVRKDQQEQGKARLRALIEEGLSSGAAQPSTDADEQELLAIARGDIA